MNQIQFTVYGEPKAQKRHRHSTVGKFVKTYDPGKSDKQDFLLMAQVNRPKAPITTPIRLRLKFFFSRPKSHYGTGKNAQTLKDSAPLVHVSKPDCDNLQKFVMDALNKVFWADDSLIYSIEAIKYYSDTPRIEVSLEY